MYKNNVNKKMLYIVYLVLWVIYPISSAHAYRGNKLAFYISTTITLMLIGCVTNLLIVLFKGFLKICRYEEDDIDTGF